MIQAIVNLLPWKTIARACLGKYLSNPKLKEQVFLDLRSQAQKTETKFDDAAVDTFEDMWNVVMPVLLGKL